jgi:hypothetical protein
MAILTRAVHLALAAALLLIAAPGRAEQRTSTAEDDVKATFLYNFARFVDWPAAIESRPSGDFRICTLADEAFDGALDRIVAGEHVRGHAIQRYTPRNAEDARSCQILFIGRTRMKESERFIAAVREAPVLIVGETPGFVTHGGHIGFVIEDNRVKFDANPQAATGAGLNVSSKLLRVARNVTRERTR